MKSAVAMTWAVVLMAVGACTPSEQDGASSDDLTSLEGAEYQIQYDAFVYVDRHADDDAIRWAVARQIKSSLGALRERGIGVLDRDARTNLEASTWVRTPLTVVDAGGGAEDLLRVTYRYRDTALVDRDRRPQGPIELTLLAGDYAGRYADLVPACVDDPQPHADSLWYHYHPGRSACRARISSERLAIANATQALDDPNTQISRTDRDRLFMPTRAVLTPVDDPPTLYPEYDQLWGFSGNTTRTHLVAYAFFGVDRDEANPADYGLRELMRFQRTLRARFPALHVVRTEPFSMLLDFWVRGRKLEGVSFDQVERWVLEGTGWPAEVANSADRDELLGQVVEHFSERWIYWELPVRVTSNGASRDMTVQLRTFYGYEDGSPEIRQRARWRYLEAFWHGDVFAYTGHSHFGHGPLEPFDYGSENFPDRYQVMLINSCLSFNYYDQDFLDMHPAGPAQLDVVTNGLAAYWHGMGAATAGYIAGLIDGEGKSWRQVLEGMRVDLPWERGYDPMRAVNGELDNLFDGAGIDLSVVPR